MPPAGPPQPAPPPFADRRGGYGCPPNHGRGPKRRRRAAPPQWRATGSDRALRPQAADTRPDTRRLVQGLGAECGRQLLQVRKRDCADSLVVAGSAAAAPALGHEGAAVARAAQPAQNPLEPRSLVHHRVHALRSGGGRGGGGRGCGGGVGVGAVAAGVRGGPLAMMRGGAAGRRGGRRGRRAPSALDSPDSCSKLGRCDSHASSNLRSAAILRRSSRLAATRC